MKKKQVIILGGGVSGLALRYFLTQRRSDLEVTLLEAKNRLGGVIESQNKGGFFFEKGPRTFKASKNYALLELISELELDKEIVVSKKGAARRFLWKDNRLQELPRSPFSLFASPLTRRLLPGLLKEWKQKSKEGDETIHQFIARRLGPYAADVFFDPMALGIYAGDIRKLSVVSCFPKFKELEKTYGSLTRGFLKKRRKPAFPFPEGVHASSLFTLKEGVKTLAIKLAEKGKGEVHLETFAQAVQFKKGKVLVESNGKTWEADHLFCALSAKGASQLTKSWDENIRAFFQNLEMASVSVVHLGFQNHRLKEEGFGYLIPSSEGEKILGVIFDSSAFPVQNRYEFETRLSVMLGGAFFPSYHQSDTFEKIEEALRGIRTHLGIATEPIWKDVTDYPQSIPQYTVGHQARTEAFRETVHKKNPQVTFLGNYLDGVAINDCVAGAKKAQSNLRL